MVSLMFLNRKMIQRLKTIQESSKSIVEVVTTLIHVISLFILIVISHFPI
jgi:hypothetical protein